MSGTRNMNYILSNDKPISYRDRTWEHIKCVFAEACQAPASSPIGRACILFALLPASVVTISATGTFVHMYNAARERAQYINTHNLPFSPPDAMCPLAGAIGGAVVILIFAGVFLEVVTGKGIPQLMLIVLARFRRSYA